METAMLMRTGQRWSSKHGMMQACLEVKGILTTLHENTGEIDKVVGQLVDLEIKYTDISIERPALQSNNQTEKLHIFCLFHCGLL